jgi:hypothetical protein
MLRLLVAARKQEEITGAAKLELRLSGGCVATAFPSRWMVVLCGGFNPNLRAGRATGNSR